MPQKMIQSIYHFHSKEGINMNKIYKVIWSKAKHTYVVASEIAKGHTKGETTGKGLKKLAAALLVAAALLSPSFAWAADTTTVTDTSTVQQTVYTKDGADNTFATKGSLDKEAADREAADTKEAGVREAADTKEAAAREAADTTLQSNIDKEATAREVADTKLQTAVEAKANAADVYSKTDTDTKLADKANAADVYSKTDTDTKLADKANTADVYSKTDADAKFATNDQLQKKVDDEKTARESADSALDSRTSALEAKTGSLNRVAAANSTSINESMTLKGNQYSATLQVNGSGAQIGVVNNEAAGLANDGGTAYTEYRAKTGVILSKATNDISSTSSNGQVVDTAGDTTGEYSQAATKSTGTTFTYSNDGGKTSSSTTIKGNSVSTGTVSATAGITDETTKDGTSVIASQTVGQNLNALDERITNVKEYLEKQTSDTYVSKDDAAVQDGAIVKADKTIGENVTNLDAALAKETAARIGADKAQDEVIQQVNDNAAAGIKTLTEAYKNEVAAREAADTAETSARVAADTKLVEAVNSGVSLSNDNVLQKNTTSIDAQGNVTTSKTDANEMILNKGKDNQITLSENGIKVGLNSGVMDKDGFYAGADDYTHASAALKSDGSIKGADGKFTVDGTTGNVSTKGSLTAASGTIGNVSMSADGTVTGVKDLTASGKVTAGSFTDGTATMSNGSLNGVNQINATGNIVTTSNMQAHDMTATGTITGQNINGTTGTFGSLSTTGNASVGGTLTTNGITNTGNATTDTLTVNHNATVGGNLGVTGDITGKSLNVGTGDIKGGQITGTGLDVGAGTIKTTGAVETGTLETTGNAEIGGDLTVDKNLTVNGTFDAKTLSSTVDANNYTTINGGNVTSHNMKLSDVNGRTYTSTSKFNEEGRTDTAADGTTTNVSVMTAGGSDSTISSLADANQKSYITQNLKKILQGIKNGTNESTVDQTETGIKSTATDGKNTASTNLSNKGFNTYATDGTNRTYTLQTAESLTSQIGDDGKVKSVMNADGITNNADGGTITNSAKDLVNKATGNMTNTVGGEMKTTVTGNVTEDFKADLSTTVGGNKSETVTGTSTETVTGKKTENYNSGLETTVTGEEKHTVNGSQTNAITGDQTNTIGGSQTTTVTGDSSLTAENITNEAKNKITNKAIDVETDAASSIVSKVSNDAGSNTSTQLSYETKEEMSANGKTASYLRGAAEEKSQLIDGDKKTTIDTVAGQTNTNITDGTNTSNDLQKADQIASSVTDGTNTTVVNQDAKSLASSITAGTKANNTSSTVDASVQRIQTDDTHYSVSSKSASKMEDALFNGSTVIDSLKDAEKGLVSTAVTDGATITGISQNAKDISLSAAGGTIASGAKNISNTAAEKLSNSAADIENKASKSILNQVGENTSWKMTDGTVVESVKDASGKTNQTTTTAADTYQFVKDGNNTLAKRTSSTNDNLNITDGNNTYTKITTATGNKQTVTDGMETASTNLTKSASNTLIENGTQSVLDHMAADTSYTVMNENGNGSRQQQTASEILDRVTDGKNTSEVKMTANGITNTAEGGTIYNKSKDILNEASGDILNFADGEIGNVATKITNRTGDNTVTSDTKGTTFGNTNKKDTVTFMDEEKSVDTKKTTISGNTITTGEAVMDYADVMKDLGVRGNATVDKKLTVKGDSDLQGNATVGKDLEVKGSTKLDGTLEVVGKSTFKDDVTMEKNLHVKGTTTTDKLVVDNGATIKGGATVTGGTTTDTLHVTSTATFDDIVTMKKDLNVGGNAKVDGDVTAKSFKVGDKTYINEKGINANNQVIRNVGQGDISEGSTDAVSGGQLYETNTRVSGLETRMGTVETRVDKLDNKIDKVGANAAAMANLHPLEFDEDSKWNVAAAVGSSGSETASAVGVFYRPNENVMVNASAAMGTGENMFGGGVSLRLGHGGNKAKEAQMKAAAAENKELRAKVDDLTARMDALLSVLNPNMSKDFPDVPENHWAYEAVSRLAGNGIVEGYEDGKYHGERQMTRYEMAEIIYNALSKGAKAEKKLVEEFRPELQAMAAQKKA